MSDHLADIKAREQAATPGPWIAEGSWVWTEDDRLDDLVCVASRKSRLNVDADAEFIAHGRTDIPILLRQVERLERWKAEALPVMDGLQELGEALDLPLGARITGREALALVESEREWAEAEVEQLRERALGSEQCCFDVCNGGVCEACVSCSAGWCVNGHDFVTVDGKPDGEWEHMSDEDRDRWFEVARGHNVGLDAALKRAERAEAEVERLCSERAEAERAEAEVERLRATLARVEALADAADNVGGEHFHRLGTNADWDCGQCWVLGVRATLAGRPTCRTCGDDDPAGCERHDLCCDDCHDADPAPSEGADHG